jgi:hypothetical protein
MGILKLSFLMNGVPRAALDDVEKQLPDVP